MSGIYIKHELCDGCGLCISKCPFEAIEKDEKIKISSGCKLCKLCIKACPKQAIALAEGGKSVNKEAWKGILIYVEYEGNKIHPVTLELIGKARQLIQERNKGEECSCIFIGNGIAENEVTGNEVTGNSVTRNSLEEEAQHLFDYGVDKVYVYEGEDYAHFRVDAYAAAFEDCIRDLKPNVVLIGATAVGRSLAPRVATRFETGLTADCTSLEIRPDGNLVQIRPAFGGNIMAQILTKNHRPQFATVRYKVMEPAEKCPGHKGSIIKRQLKGLSSTIQVLSAQPKEKVKSIVDAEVLVVAGRGVKTKEDLGLLRELASLLNGQLACTRPLAEQGFLENTCQIGLSGRTVKPKLIITCGVSGAIQFVAGMQSSECIISINKDKNAPIFKLSHYGYVGDLYEVIPRLISGLKTSGKLQMPGAEKEAAYV